MQGTDMSPNRLEGIGQRVWAWTSNVVVAMGAAVVAIGLFIGVAAADRALTCDRVDCVAEGIGQSAHNTGVALTEGAANAGRALSSLPAAVRTGFAARARASTR
jgi:hypothetical protein